MTLAENSGYNANEEVLFQSEEVPIRSFFHNDTYMEATSGSVGLLNKIEYGTDIDERITATHPTQIGLNF